MNARTTQLTFRNFGAQRLGGFAKVGVALTPATYGIMETVVVYGLMFSREVSMRFTACTFVFAILLSAYSFARQDNPLTQSDATIEPHFKADIKRMIDISHLQDRTKEVSRLRFEQLRPQLIASLPPTPNRDKIVDEYSEKYVRLFLSEDYMNQMVATYAKYLTDDDIKGLIRFYETPAGRHYVAQLPQITADGVQIAHRISEGGAPQIWKELCTEYPELQGQTKFCPQPESEKKSLLTEPALGAPGESIHGITGK